MIAVQDDVLRLLPEEARSAVQPVDHYLTELGNAELFVRHYGDRVKHCKPRRKWLVWNGNHWQWDQRGTIVELAKRTVRSLYSEASRCADESRRKAIVTHATRSEKATGIAAFLKLAESDPGVAVLPHELDSDPWLLNCKNGTLDLRTGRVRAPSRNDLITKTTPVAYDVTAYSELWNRVLWQAVGSDTGLGEYMQKIAGYALTGVSHERAFFFLHGPPGTAKSTFLDALHGALGDYAVSASSDTWLVHTSTGGNRGDVVRLAGARLVTSSEVRPGGRWDTALMKAITGGDMIVAAAKYEESVEFRPACTLILSANDAPSLRDDDDGMWARIRRIPLIAQIPAEQQDRELKFKLQRPEHAAAILAWAVAGCLAWQLNGLGTCDAVEKSTAAYRNEMDLFGRFLDECCVLDSETWISRAEFNKADNVGWCRDAGLRRPLSSREIQTRLEARGCHAKTVNGNRRWAGVRTMYAAEQLRSDVVSLSDAR
ncbi:MAG TPA: phage/plasmid primase, P4 family [Polyangiaceae bacterium]|nr:phage/plasmid primase, P4 family [Polyangiaceae bacterium]